MPQGNTLFYRMLLDTREFVSGSKLSQRELRELRRVSAEMAGEMGTAGLQFDKFARLAREGGDSAETAAMAFGRVAAKSKDLTTAAGQYITQLRREADELSRRQAAGEKLNAAEQDRLKNNRRIADDFQNASRTMRSIRAAELLDIRKEINAERDKRHEKERSIATEKKAAQAKRDKAQADREALARQREEFAAMQAGRTLVMSTMDATRKLVAKKRELREALAAGTITANQYNASMARLRTQIRESIMASRDQGGVFAGLGKQMLSVAKHIAYVTLVYKGLQAAKRAVTLSMELERANIEFEIFTGSASEGARITKELLDLASRTPLTLEGSQQATRVLLQYGVASKEVIGLLKQIGDVSGGSQERLSRLALAMGQITANGRLQGQELRQLIESGFNPLQVISERTGESMKDLRARMENGAVGVQEVRQALSWATGEGGRFNNMLDRVASETSSGSFTVMVGQFQKLGAAIGEMVTPAIKELSKAGATWADYWARKLQEANESTKIHHNDVQLLLMDYRELNKEESKRKRVLEKAARGEGDPFATSRFEAVSAVNAQMGFALLGQAELSEEAQKYLESTHEAEEAVVDVTEQYEKLVAEMEKANRIAKDGAEKEQLRELKEQGYNATQIAEIKRLQEEKQRIEKDKEAEQEKRKLKEQEDRRIEAEKERERKDAESAAEEIKAALRSPIEVLKDEILKVRDLMENEFLSFEEFNAQRDKLIKEYVDSQKKSNDKAEKITQSQSAASVTRGSSEEYQLLADMSHSNRDMAMERRMEARRAEQQREQMQQLLDQINTSIQEQTQPEAIDNF